MTREHPTHVMPKEVSDIEAIGSLTEELSEESDDE